MDTQTAADRSMNDRIRIGAKQAAVDAFTAIYDSYTRDGLTHGDAKREAQDYLSAAFSVRGINIRHVDTD